LPIQPVLHVHIHVILIHPNHRAPERHRCRRLFPASWPIAQEEKKKGKKKIGVRTFCREIVLKKEVKKMFFVCITPLKVT